MVNLWGTMDDVARSFVKLANLPPRFLGRQGFRAETFGLT